MSVTPAHKLADVLPVVISGNRPLLSHRCTSRLLAPLRGVTRDPVWLVREGNADAYERDGHELVIYPLDEAEAFAREHWIGPQPYAPGGFLGCFTEREWACRLAVERGCWAVLQLDDNILTLQAFISSCRAGARVVHEHGGLALYADLLAAVTLSTNSRMTGAKLGSLNPHNEVGQFARTGFPYSLFVERVDVDDRPPYYGPIEEDILHAYHYGVQPDDATSALVYPITYAKEHARSAKTGMRPHYQNQRRSAGLQLAAPSMVNVGVHKAHSNGRGDPRVFHRMRADALRTPLVVRDRELFEAARERCVQLRDEVAPQARGDVEQRVTLRARQADAKAALLAHLAGTH